MTGRLVWHALDVGDEPDWGQRYDNGPRPEPGPAVDVTFRVADPEPADPDPDPEPDVTFRVTEPDPDPEPDWDRLRGDVVHVWQGPLEEVPAPLPHVRHNAPSRGKKVIQDPLPRETPGGLIRRSRERMGSHRGDLDTIELAAYYKEPKWVLVQRRKNNAHWLWR
jgi:hypothetical protein